MCASCGCGEPNDQHGDSRHITGVQLKAAAQAANITPQEAASNLMKSVQGSGASSQASTSNAD